MQKILAVIPARGGSKGVLRKNIRPVLGTPLIGYTINAVLPLGHLVHRVIVSTEDPEIARVATDFGAEVPFIRPTELASDGAPTLPLLQHAVRFIESRDNVSLDWVLLLQPTSPLRTTSDIQAAISLAGQQRCDSVISVVPVVSDHPILIKRIENNQLLPYCLPEREGTRRQDLNPPAYKRNGALYLTKRDVIMNQHSIWGEKIVPYIMPEERSVNIDSELDLKLVEMLLKEQGKEEFGSQKNHRNSEKVA
ncbi:acylneuraminate cytidylyltransferase family protein [Candidatus Nitronereus thalassa]|uniref:Acylneuraminate cytidylyltransferase family protein n=1 Tax=Candidatus Nitronereus thalassa TaxID=3020898 RepID=A0ABU3K5D2_9BACT|nr:acylneuraminate cytidylyltransferase family protein [Candidatus Nitronereus thalassa]MDT7041571.1 acylneuraminate cytidylyltransferase family protein [Candidatus Nitronereus thalassa]